MARSSTRKGKVRIDPKFYQSSMVQGSYFNRMLDCGPFNRMVEIALAYLPPRVLDEHKERLAFVCMAHRDGTRLAQRLRETREIIVLSEHGLPDYNSHEGQRDFRYFIYIVLHETAHAIRKHRSPVYDSLDAREVEDQEKEADELALQWFNDHIAARANPHLPPLTREEIAQAQARTQKIMLARIGGA